MTNDWNPTPDHIQLLEKLEQIIYDIQHGADYKERRDAIYDAWIFACRQLKAADSLDYIDEDINLENWFLLYGEEARPARYMTSMPDVPLAQRESYYLNQRLKGLDGTPLDNGTHEFKFLGRKSYKQQGGMNLYACVPIDKEELPEELPDP